MEQNNKKNQRISKMQKEKLVEYMFSHLEFARGQFGGVNSNTNSKDQWESLRLILNSMGGSDKTVDQWKKCWIDLKAGVKKQLSARRAFMNRTGGGSFNDIPRDLNPLEDKILQIITIDAVDGDARTPESGVEIVEEIAAQNSEQIDVSMASIEILDDENENIPPPPNPPQPKTKRIETRAPKSSTTTASKYSEAIDEARKMQLELVGKLEQLEKQNNKLEKQNEEILKKITQLETAVNEISVSHTYIEELDEEFINSN